MSILLTNSCFCIKYTMYYYVKDICKTYIRRTRNECKERNHYRNKEPG